MQLHKVVNLQDMFDGIMDSARTKLAVLEKEKARIDTELAALRLVIDSNLAEGAKYGLKESPVRTSAPFGQ